MDTTQTLRLSAIVGTFDEKILKVLNASSAAPYRDERTLKQRAFYVDVLSGGERIYEPAHRPMQRAVWWLRYREGLSKADAWLVARHGRFSAFGRLFWREDPWKAFKRSWRAAAKDPATWSTKRPRKTRRPKTEPLWSRKSDWLPVLQWLRANPGAGHRDVRRSGVLSGRYRHLRIQAALEHLEAVELITVTRPGRGRANEYVAHGSPMIYDHDRGCAFTAIQGTALKKKDHPQEVLPVIPECLGPGFWVSDRR